MAMKKSEVVAAKRSLIKFVNDVVKLDDAAVFAMVKERFPAVVEQEQQSRIELERFLFKNEVDNLFPDHKLY